MHTAFNWLPYVLNDIEIPTSHPSAGAPAVDWCVLLCADGCGEEKEDEG